MQPRPESLAAIDAAMKRMRGRIKAGIRGAQLTEGNARERVTKLLVRADGAQIKIEVTPVLRGCVYDPELRGVSAAVEDDFGFAEIQVVSFADLYAGKIVAALDRQHPRDLFDVRDLLANEGIDDELRRAFIVYMLSHDRPMSEVLAPTRAIRKDISEEFLRGFEGMTEQPVARDDLDRTRGSAHRGHRRQDAEGTPPISGFVRAGRSRTGTFCKAWGAHVADLPAVRWRQQNLDKLSRAKSRDALVSRLQEVLSVSEK